MKRRHSMPFGAECQDDGSVRFRLWAPAAQQVELSLPEGVHPTLLPLEPRDYGWFELTTNVAQAGSRYCFRIDENLEVPDPAARFQPHDVHGPSEVIDPSAFDWQDETWRGRPWHEAVIYELHVGTFTRTGTFAAAIEHLDYLADLGVAAIELMPVSDFPGKRNWGYDGVFPFAPDSTYGKPDDLKALIQAAHARGLMVFLDVVYNHFGPEGNYLNAYAPQFFTSRHKSPWGDGINFDGADDRPVRDFFIHNALYWLTEYNFDGLRLDAVHAIVDDSRPDILTELAETVHAALPPDRYVHLILENERNQAKYLRRNSSCRPKTYTAQWDDDIHHVLHVLVTGEQDGYYSDYTDVTADRLGRCLTEGFAYQGDVSHYKHGAKRGESTQGLPLTAFVTFLQNHDQIGNRAFGDRITKCSDPRAVRAAVAVLLLTPSPPLLFMGEEFGADTPFLFFSDFQGDLATAVTQGRRNEFARFSSFNDPAKREQIPDPNALATFQASQLAWETISQPQHQEWLALYRQLLQLRRQHIIPRLAAACKIDSSYQVIENRGVRVVWKFPDSTLVLVANLSAESLPNISNPASPIIYSNAATDDLAHGTLAPWSVNWFLES